MNLDQCVNIAIGGRIITSNTENNTTSCCRNTNGAVGIECIAVGVHFSIDDVIVSTSAFCVLQIKPCAEGICGLPKRSHLGLYVLYLAGNEWGYKATVPECQSTGDMSSDESRWKVTARNSLSMTAEKKRIRISKYKR